METLGLLFYISRCGGIGRHVGFRFRCQKRRGSNPLTWTIYIRVENILLYEKGGDKVNYTTGFISYPKQWITNSPKIGDAH